MRVWLLAGILGAELIVISRQPHVWIVDVPIGHAAIVFGAAVLFFGRKKFPSLSFEDCVFDWRFAMLHGLAFAANMWAALQLRAITDAGWNGPLHTMVGVWSVSLLVLVISLLFALFSRSSMLRLLHGFGAAWIYAAITTAAVIAAKQAMQAKWDLAGSAIGHALQTGAYSGAAALLRLFYPGVLAVPSERLLGTAKFQIIIAGSCSGVEGLCLMLGLTVGWLIFERNTLRLGRAVWLVPLSLLAIWLLNLVRLVALIAIGDAGHEDIAIHGFHSQAGWIFFNVVAIAFLLAASHLPWLRKDAVSATRAPAAIERNVAVVYLLPFVAALAASMIGRAASSGFDWMYPLRLAAVAAVLWWFRAEYRKAGPLGIDWRFGWVGISAGVAVFAMWFGLARWQHLGVTSELGSALAGLARWQRIGWISARTLAAIVTVPIAEELAFRGYIARRLMAEDVEAVSFRNLSVWAMLGSSLLFGVMHGKMWIAGVIAGLVFALVAKLRGRLGEAVAAHAVANLLIAVWVLTTGDFGMW